MPVERMNSPKRSSSRIGLSSVVLLGNLSDWLTVKLRATCVYFSRWRVESIARRFLSASSVIGLSKDSCGQGTLRSTSIFFLGKGFFLFSFLFFLGES